MLFNTCIKTHGNQAHWHEVGGGGGGGGYFRENYPRDDIIFTRNLKIPKLHINGNDICF